MALIPQGRRADLEDLGFDPGSYTCLLECATRSAGIVVIIGPSGSGKRTTADALARRAVTHGAPQPLLNEVTSSTTWSDAVRTASLGQPVICTMAVPGIDSMRERMATFGTAPGAGVGRITAVVSQRLVRTICV